jgi:hypothetical protein
LRPSRRFWATTVPSLWTSAAMRPTEEGGSSCRRSRWPGRTNGPRPIGTGLGRGRRGRSSTGSSGSWVRWGEEALHPGRPPASEALELALGEIPSPAGDRLVGPFFGQNPGKTDQMNGQVVVPDPPGFPGIAHRGPQKG